MAKTISNMTVDDFKGLLELDKIVSDLFKWTDTAAGKDISFEEVERDSVGFGKTRYPPFSVCNGTYGLARKWMREKGWNFEDWEPLFTEFGAKYDCTVSMNP